MYVCNKCMLQDIPQEIQSQILTNLCLEDLLSTSQTCHHNNNLVFSLVMKKIKGKQNFIDIVCKSVCEINKLANVSSVWMNSKKVKFNTCIESIVSDALDVRYVSIDIECDNLESVQACTDIFSEMVDALSVLTSMYHDSRNIKQLDLSNKGALRTRITVYADNFASNVTFETEVNGFP